MMRLEMMMMERYRRSLSLLMPRMITTGEEGLSFSCGSLFGAIPFSESSSNDSSSGGIYTCGFLASSIDGSGVQQGPGLGLYGHRKQTLSPTTSLLAFSHADFAPRPWCSLRVKSERRNMSMRWFSVDSTVENQKVEEHREKPELVDQYLSLDVSSRKEILKQELQEIKKKFQRYPGDTGSSEVQAALLTSKIKMLSEHLTQHRKDYSSKRGVVAMINRRRKLLQYLRRHDYDRYITLISKLGLKDSFAKQDRLSMRYKPAVRDKSGKKI